jgi:CubicO group peptidase (beta-lactamase class C family)
VDLAGNNRAGHYGPANDQADMSEHTIICIGSTTKVFTASMISYLRVTDEVGPLDQAYVFPHLTVVAPKMTLLQLATHTSGMPENAPGDRAKRYLKTNRLRHSSCNGGRTHPIFS